jgi:hypothetical protein
MKYRQSWCPGEYTILKSLFDICVLAASCASFSLWGTQWRCFTIKPIELTSRSQTIVSGIHILLAKSDTDWNGYLSRDARIAWSIKPGPWNFGTISLFAVHHASLNYFVTIDYAIASEPMIATNYPWISEVENICLARKGQIERWSILHDVKM